MKNIIKIFVVLTFVFLITFSNNAYAESVNSIKSKDPKVVLSSQKYNELNKELNSDGYRVDMKNVEITYQDNEIIVGNIKTVNKQWLKGFENSSTVKTYNFKENSDGMERTTVSSGSGYAKLDNVGRGRSLRWAVRPNTYWPYVFSGTVSLNYDSGYKRIQPVRGVSAARQEVSGFVYMNANNGGVGTLNGTAVGDGVYFVLPGVSIRF